MGMSGDRAAYQREYELYERALASERGIQIVCESRQKAMQLSFRLNRARQLDRVLNRQMYTDQPDHPLYNNSEYAAILVRSPVWDHINDRWLCQLEKAGIQDMVIEDIPPPMTDEELQEILSDVTGTDDS